MCRKACLQEAKGEREREGKRTFWWKGNRIERQGQEKEVPLVFVHPHYHTIFYATYILWVGCSNCREHEESDDTSDDEVEKDRRKKKGTYDCSHLFVWSSTLLGLGGSGACLATRVKIPQAYKPQNGVLLTSLWPNQPHGRMFLLIILELWVWKCHVRPTLPAPGPRSSGQQWRSWRKPPAPSG